MTDTILDTTPTDPRAKPLIEDLIREYDSRYGVVFNPEGSQAELHRYPPEAFVPPDGSFLLLLRDGQTIGGGAFKRLDDVTAELKRIWTRGDLRRQGLAQRLVAALEDRAARLGYTRVYLTTGFRQPEAQALYLGLDYRPLFDTRIAPEFYKTLPFEKHIGALAGQPGRAPLKQPDAELAASLGYRHPATTRARRNVAGGAWHLPPASREAQTGRPEAGRPLADKHAAQRS